MFNVGPPNRRQSKRGFIYTQPRGRVDRGVSTSTRSRRVRRADNEKQQATKEKIYIEEEEEPEK